MGVGIKWVFMAIRLFLYAMLELQYLLPHILWYILSPNIIRRVAYRSSKRTKRRNLEIFLKKITRDGPLLYGAEEVLAARANNNNIALNNPTVSTSFTKSMVGQPNAVEILATSLNPADGRFMSGLPQCMTTGGSSDSALQFSSSDSFANTISAIQRYYCGNAGGTETAEEGTVTAPTSGEKRNTDPKIDEVMMDAPSTAESDDDEDEEDRKNLHNRATLDIYLPIPLDALFRMMEQEKTISARSRLHRRRFPIVISIIGGAWIIGSNLWSFLIARLLAARGYIVFCPDYRNFPQTDMEGMVRDVSDAIQWVLQNAERYSGDLEDVTLIGQSAGAHLTMMSLLSQAQLHAQQAAANSNNNNNHHHHRHRNTESDGESSNSEENLNKTQRKNFAYNVKRYNPRQSIQRYVGVSGIYNIRGLVRHFHRRGLYKRVLYQIAGGRDNMPRYSLNTYFTERRCAETGEAIPKNIFDFLPQYMFFIHGDADCSAPLSESANIAFVMRNAQRAHLAERYTSTEYLQAVKSRVRPVVIEFILVPGANHTDAIVDECICSNSSHVVDFLYSYSTNDERRERQLASPVVSDINNEMDEDEGEIVPSRHPDGILYTPAPHDKRPILMRWAAYVCPF
ncbi:Alpha/beta hydrolase fold-3 [Trypanosoma melophagium]|uniref:Alpha/beta hydrolase fold-3 n=1 Tax=Trypanosoma melophagium TaxID=715481 RepID=UPI00351A150D|nr:Alpha/beta hydrolase fold-3 [Trypanosoma melophagium]